MRVSLGPSTIERLLPHREPFLLVDGITRFSDALPMGIEAKLHVSAQSPVLAGHFPSRPVWPGTYTIEGLAQAAGLISGMSALYSGARRAGLAIEGLEDPAAGEILESEPSHRGPFPGLLAKVDVRLLEPVLPETTLEYCVRRTHDRAGVFRFEATASVRRTLVARGTLVAVASAEGFG